MPAYSHLRKCKYTVPYYIGQVSSRNLLNIHYDYFTTLNMTVQLTALQHFCKSFQSAVVGGDEASVVHQCTDSRLQRTSVRQFSIRCSRRFIRSCDGHHCWQIH